MDNEEAGQSNVADKNTNKYDFGFNEYRVYEHPLLAKKIVKKGFCWPVLFLGPVYLMYKKLWLVVATWIVVVGLARYYAISEYPMYNKPFSEDGSRVDQICGLTILLCLIVLWIITNHVWESDLEKRGYIMTKSLGARSMDDALAIIERERK